MRISELPLTTNPTSTDDLPIDRNGVTYRVKYEALRGPKGDPGEDGQPGRDGTIENLDVAATTLPAGSQATASYENNLLTLGIPQGAKGEPGDDGQDGVGVPPGGTTGQVLKKKSGTDYDTEWANESGGGGGGTWGSITGTLSNQTDLQTALDEKAKKAINVNISSSAEFSVGTWSYDVVTNAGEPSGGSCYYRLINTSLFSGVTIYHKFSCSVLKGFSGVVYITTQANGILIETSKQPESSYRIVGTIIEGKDGTAPSPTKITASVSGLTNDAGYLVPSDISALTTYSHDEVTAYGLTIAFTRYGGVVMANCYSGTLSQAVALTVIYTMPEKYRPMNNYDTVNAVSGVNTIQRVIFNANGELTLNFSAAAGTALRFSATYLAQGLAPNT